MNFYIIELDNCIKVGISSNIENRLLSFSDIKNQIIFEIDSYELGNYIEVSVINHFNSDTEYLYDVNLNDVIAFVKGKLKVSICNVVFAPLGIELVLNSDGLYKVNPIIDYINGIRNKKNKGNVFIADYLKNQQTKEFLNYVEHRTDKKSILAKQGKYGGTYAVAQVIIDIIMWGDTSTKYDILKWMNENKTEYIKFISSNIGD